MLRRRFAQVGTGFVVGTDQSGASIIITNRHVVEVALRYGWGDVRGITLSCDFARHSAIEDDDRASYLVSVEKPPEVHSTYDLAVVALDSRANMRELRSELLNIQRTAPILGSNAAVEVGVLGHPSFDSARDPFPSHFGFGEGFGIKRFSPGYVRRVEKRKWRAQFTDIFLHDATTLSGSSGSCILDLNTNAVVGLHFGGWPLPKRAIKTPDGQDIIAQLFESNGAVPLWLLENDPILSNARFCS